jgi:hypothetical protein
MGPVRAELLAPGPDGLDALLDEAFSIEERSWKGRATPLRRHEGRRVIPRAALTIAYWDDPPTTPWRPIPSTAHGRSSSGSGTPARASSRA